MPNELALTGAKALHASAAETTAGTGDPIDIGDRSYAELLLDVTAISGTLQVTVETSATLSGWSLIGRLPAVTAPGDTEFLIPDCKRYLRAKWTVGASATFSLTGTASQLYARPKDLENFFNTSSRRALEGIPVQEVARACLAASAEAEGYLATAYDLPIATLDVATRRHVAAMAAYELMRFRHDGTTLSAALEVGRSEAVNWLTKIMGGRLKPDGVVDATPGNDTPTTGPSSAGSTGALIVVSGGGRGWGR